MRLSEDGFRWLDEWLSELEGPSFLLCLKGRLLGANEAFLNHFGLPSGSGLAPFRGRPLPEVIGSRADRALLVLIEDGMMARPPLNQDGAIWRKRGLWIPGLKSCLLFRTSTSPISESDLKTRDELISMASHEIRTPLTSIQLLMQILSRLTEKPDTFSRGIEKVGQIIQDATLQVNQVSRLLDQLLDLSRERRGHFNTKKSLINLSLVLREAIDLARPQLETKQVLLSFEGPPDAPILGDADGLRCLFLNLIVNAIKYGSASPIEILIQALDSELRTLVIDHGVGIPEDKIGRLFLPFERGSNCGDNHGHGLGLYISRSIAENHGGKIWIEPSSPRGATVVVSLPRAGD